MAAKVKVSGLDTIIKNLNKEVAKIEGNVQKGLTIAGLFIKGRSMDKTPVDVGNLWASHYLVSGDGTKSEETGFRPDRSGSNRVADEHSGHIQEALVRMRTKNKPFIEIGLTAFYAEHVHEDLEARHPTGECKFLEKAITQNYKKTVDTIKRFAKV